MHRAIYPNAFHQRKAEAAPGCPTFGDRTVLERPPEILAVGDDPSVKPGLHSPQQGGHKVVWWDPKVLCLHVEPSFGVRQEDILAEGPNAAASIATHAAWLAAREDRLAGGARPAFDVFTPTDGRPLPDGFFAEVELVALDHPPGRPTGPRFGSLMHAILRYIDLGANAEQINTAVAFHSRIHAATDQESEAARQTVARVLASPLIARARAAERVHREWPINLALGGGQMLEGTVDLAFLEAGAWQIVDFKTDEDLTRGLSRYRTQVQWYVLAVQRLTGLAATGRLLAL